MSSAEHLNLVDRVILLLLRAQDRSAVPGRLFLQKEVYALHRGLSDLATELSFDSHLLGPHSDVLETECEQMELSGFVDSTGGVYKLTETGSHIADELARRFPLEDTKLIEETKQLFNDLAPDELLALIYLGDEDSGFEAESAEYQKIKRNRVPLALRLLKKNKVSTSKAAKIAGLSVDDLISRFDSIPA
jgi:uncharacterized protein YwgA